MERPVSSVLLLCFALSLVPAAAQTPPNPLAGPWELLPIAEQLEEQTRFYVTNIDDLASERDSTVDIFIFQPVQDAIWVKTIRGASTDPTRIQIPMSDNCITRVVYFDSDGYPDLIQISRTKKTVRILLNRVRENQDRLKREALNPEVGVTDNKHEDDWINEELLTISTQAEYVDLLYGDINMDGVEDIVLAGRRMDKTYFIQLLLFTTKGSFSFQTMEIAVDSRGISQLLSIGDINKDHRNELLYLTASNHLAYILNEDPVYRSQLVLSTAIELKGKIKHFALVDLTENGNTDFIFPAVSELDLIKQTGTANWAKVSLLSSDLQDASVCDVTNTGKTDMVLLWADHIALLAQTYLPRDETDIEVEYMWQTADGTTFGYILYPLNIDAGNWDSIVTTDLSGTKQLDLVLYSESQHKIVWGRRAFKTPSGLGWDPNFWVYVMCYVILASLVLVTMHFYWDSKLQEEERKLLGEAEVPKVVWEPEQPQSGKRGANRKTTV
jgi:hypothetical protein